MSRFQVFSQRRRPLGRAAITSCVALAPLVLSVLGQSGCGTSNTYYETHIHSSRGDAGTSSPEKPIQEPPDTSPAGSGGGPNTDEDPPPVTDAGTDPNEPDDGLPRVNTAPDALQVDVFGTAGNRYYLVVSDEQLERMNEAYGGGFPGGPIIEPFPVFDNPFGDIYTPGGGVDASGVTFVDHLFVSTPADPPSTADFGKVQVKLVGQSTGRPWTTQSLPNFKIDSDEFVEGNRIGGVKHMRLNNAVIGSIFREKLTLDLYAALGYPAPRATYAWVQSSVWGPEISVPYIAVESYKPAFCKQREAELGGGCVNMWEFWGDFGFGMFSAPENCQFSECDATRANEFELDVVATPPGPGFQEALSDWVDWDAFQRFQCLSWILETGDDALHNSNNFVIVERTDGKFQHLPYSVDISLGQDWYQDVPLAGSSLLARGCQNDPTCWDGLLATCEDMVADFIAANPIAMLDATYALLEQHGMLRDGDEQRYSDLSSYLAQRIEELPIELQQNREQGPPPDGGFCEYPYVMCGELCLLPEECFVCEPPPDPGPGQGPDAGVGEVPVPIDGIAGAGGVAPGAFEGVAADVALPVDPRPEPPVPPPVDPGECLPLIEPYAVPAAPAPR